MSANPVVRFRFRGPLDLTANDLLLTFAVEGRGVLRDATALVEKRSGRVRFPHFVLETGESLGTDELDGQLLERAETDRGLDGCVRALGTQRTPPRRETVMTEDWDDMPFIWPDLDDRVNRAKEQMPIRT